MQGHAGAVRQRLGDPRLDIEGVQTLREILIATGALDKVEQMVTDLVAASRMALAHSNVTEPARESSMAASNTPCAAM